MSEERRRSPSSRPRQPEKRAEPAVKENSNKKKPQRGSLMNAALIAVLALLIAAGVFILGYYATSVRKITVEGNSILTDEQVINLAGLYTGRNIFSYDLGAAKRGIETNPYLKCTGIKRSLPNRLVISISERKEFAALLLGSSDYCVIDCTGFVLDIGRSEESVRGLLPVYGLSAMGIRVGMNIDADKGKLRPFTVMQMIEALGSRAGEIRCIDVSNTSSVKLITKSGITVMLGDSVNIPSKIERMFRAIPKVDPERADTAIIYVNSSGTTDLSYPTPLPSAEPTDGPEDTEAP